MKKTILFLLCFSGILTLNASELTSGFNQKPAVIEFLPEYAYNKNWGSMANFNFKSNVGFCKYFQLGSAIQLSTANVYTVNVTARPRIPLKIGEIFFEVEPCYRAIVRDNTHDFCLAASVGYRFDYLSFQFGWFGRWMKPFEGGDALTELVNPIYRVEAFCRPQSEVWNISVCIANIDNFQMERWQQPLFMIGGRYNIAGKVRLSAGVEIKPTGIMHATASFYGAMGYIGIGFLFGK